jgi:hypothetical protein
MHDRAKYLIYSTNWSARLLILINSLAETRRRLNQKIGRE